MSENVWFKHWAKKSLSSEDLNSLTDHEERVWWRFLSVASSQEPRWTVVYSLKLTPPALARSCASTPPKLKAALARFEAMGMLTPIDGGWAVTNAERHQETPEAKRKREQRERDKSRDMSQDSHRPSHASLLREEEQKTEDRSVEPKGSPESVAPKRRTPKPPLVELTGEERLRLVADFPYPGVNDQIDLALAHESHLKYPTGQYLYVRNWLRKTDWERTNGNGRNNHNSPNKAAEIAGLAAFE